MQLYIIDEMLYKLFVHMLSELSYRWVSVCWYTNVHSRTIKCSTPFFTWRVICSSIRPFCFYLMMFLIGQKKYWLSQKNVALPMRTLITKYHSSAFKMTFHSVAVSDSSDPAWMGWNGKTPPVQSPEGWESKPAKHLKC